MSLITETTRIKELMGIDKQSSFVDSNFCSKFTNQNEKKTCSGIEKLIRENPWGNLLKNKINTLFTSFGKKGDDVVYDDISYYEDLHTQKINNLVEFINVIPDGCNTLKDRAQSSLNQLKNGRKILMYRKDGKLSYSYFNRLNTNYTALSVLLTEYAIFKNILDKSYEEIINEFLNNSDSQDFMDDVLIGLKKNVSDKILDVISTTRKIGNKSEENYMEYLNNQGIKYLDFSDDFGSVDFLGIDLMVKFPGQDYYSPIQVKSRYTDFNKLAISKYCQTNCNCFLVYPENGDWVKINCGNESSDIIPEGVQTIKSRSITFSDKYGDKYFCNGSYPNYIDKTKSTIIITDGVKSFELRPNNIRISSNGSFYFNKEDGKEIVL